MADFTSIAGLLIDLDGTLYIGDKIIEGAREAVEELRGRKIKFRFTTNTTTRSLASLHEKLTRLGLPVEEDELFGVIQATRHYLDLKGRPTCFFLLTDSPMDDFKEYPKDEESPEYVVIGDVGKYWDYELMNKLFKMVMSGSKMIAMHKGKYWQTEGGLRVDIGAFVAGLEYATGEKATLIGKPSPEFYSYALKALSLSANEVAMIGDDIHSDAGGAQSVGIMGGLVRTGKYRKETEEESSVVPDFVIDSIADLPALLSK